MEALVIWCLLASLGSEVFQPISEGLAGGQTGHWSPLPLSNEMATA